jgi:hypothetical protein
MTDLRTAALNAEDITTELVTVPEWGGNVYGVKAMTLKQQRAFLRTVTDPDGGVNRDKYVAQLLIRTIVDPDTGEPVFEAADAAALEAKSASAIGRVLTIAARLAGLGGDEQVDEAVASLDETPTDDSDSS